MDLVDAVVIIRMLNRLDMINKRLELSDSDVLAYSNNVIDKIKQLDFYNEDMIIGLYMPIKNELDIKLNNKVICYPKVVGNDLEFYIPTKFELGSFNVLEPIGSLIDKNDIDIIIVPLLFFDKYNNRVGYGKGYYDRYLKDYKGITIGVGYDFQEVEEIDAKPTDIKLNYIIKGVKE